MSRKTGAFYEKQTCDWLIENNYQILKQNFSCRHGEIDIIAQNPQGVLCFVEVRYRKENLYGGALASVSRSKQLKVIKAACYFLTEYAKYRDFPIRFDVFAWESDRSPNVIQNAFSE